MLRALTLLLALLAAPVARAELPGEIVALEVLPGWRMEDGSHMAALRLTLAPGWKTYWRAPGDAGIPPLFDWRGSGNLAAAELRWPVPEVWDQNGMRSIGYHDGVVLPVQIRPRRPGEPVRLAGTVDLGVCEEICVPARLRFEALLPAEGRRDPRIVAALVDRPLTAAEGGVTARACRILPGADGLTLSARVEMPPAGGREAMVIETADPTVWVSEPRVSRRGGVLVAEARLVPAAPGTAIDRSGLRLTVLGDRQAVDIPGCPSP